MRPRGWGGWEKQDDSTDLIAQFFPHIFKTGITSALESAPSLWSRETLVRKDGEVMLARIVGVYGPAHVV